MASRKEYEMLFQLNAQMGSSYNSTFSKAQAQLATMQREIQSLSKTQSDISAYQKQQSAVEATRSKLAVLQQQYDNIQREIKETEGYSSSLENKLLSKQQQIDKTSASLQAQTSKLDSMGNALREAGIDTDNLTKESSELAAKIGDIKDKQNEVANSSEKFGNSSVDAFEEIQAAIAAAGIAKMYKEIAEEIVECTKASIEFESAVTGVYKTVDGTDEQLAAISAGIKEMSTEIPVTTTEIAGVAEAAGQLGIATEDVLSFTRVMLDLGESTNLTADDASSALAKFANITGTAATDYSRLGSVVVDLGNNFATTEADIVAMSTRLASAGTLAGFSEAEIMALAAAMSSVGIEAEAGGTAMTQTLTSIEEAVAKGGDELNEFARIAGMSSEQFASAWNDRPIEAVQAFIAGLGNLDAQGESAVLVLDELGLTGVRQSNMLKSLGLAAETLGDSISTANKAWDENTALSVEANKRYATTESKLAMLQNSYNNLQVAIGDVYAPTLREVAELGNDVLEDVTKFVEANPEVIKMLTALGIGVGAFVAALAGYIVVSKLATAATTALTAAMEANPYLLAASAIIGVVTAVATLAVTANDADEEIVKLTASSESQQQEIKKLTAEYEGLCEAGKENTEEAHILKFQIDSLTESFNGQKQTLEDYIAECEELNKTWNDTLDTNRDSVNEIEINEGRTQALITRLSELASQTNKTAAAQEEMKAIIAELNELLPGVSFNYDDVKDGLGEIEQLLENEKTAQANLAKVEEARKSMMEADTTKASAKSKLKELQANYDTEDRLNKQLKESYETAEKAYSSWLNQGGRGNQGDSLKKAVAEAKAAYDASEVALENYQKQIDDANATITQAQTDYDEYLKTIVETSGITIESIDTLTALDEVIASASLNMQSLASTYTLAYTLAKESFEGQYGLFDQAQADMEATVSSAQTALDSQLNFWQTYANNVSVLRSVSAEDLGVTQENYDEIMAYAQSGTEEAAGFAQSLAQAVNSGNTEAITQLANTVGEVKKARELAAGEVSAWQTDFNSKMQEIISTMEKSMEEMNMSKEATEAAKATMSSYAAQISTQGEKAVANALSVAEQVRAALQSGSANINIGVTGGGTTGKGYATGTKNATPGWHMVGENGPELLWFNGGETVLTAQESLDAMQDYVQVVALAPQLITAMNAYGAYTSAEKAEAIAGYSAAPVSIQVSFQIEGNANTETVEALNDYGTDFAEKVLSVVEEAGIDIARRSYI